MRKFILMAALVVIAFACSEPVGQMLVDAGNVIRDGAVPDAGAQPGDLTLQCDGMNGSDRVAVAASSQLPGVFAAYLCTDAESGFPIFFGDAAEQPKCIVAMPAVMPDGSYQFNCTRQNAAYTGLDSTVAEPSYVRVVR